MTARTGSQFFTAAMLLARSGWWAILAFGLCGVLVVSFGASSFSARHPATVALDVGLSFIRLLMPVTVAIWTQELISQEFLRRFYLLSFSYPYSRTRWLLSRVGVIYLFVVLQLLILSVALALVVGLVAKSYQQGTPVDLGLSYLVTIFSLAMEAAPIVAVAALLAVVVAAPGTVLIGTLGFTVIARSYAAIIELLTANENLVSAIADPRAYTDTLSALRYLIPDLGSLDVRMAALYGQLQFVPGDYWVRVGQVLAYAMGLLGISMWHLRRRALP